MSYDNETFKRITRFVAEFDFDVKDVVSFGASVSDGVLIFKVGDIGGVLRTVEYPFNRREENN